MKDYENKLAELKVLIFKDDEASAQRRLEISDWFKGHRSPESDEAYAAFIDDGLAAIQTEVETIRSQSEGEEYGMLPIGYIAKHYYHKSHAWLSQRLRGTKVRGKVRTLDEDEKRIFNNAMQDLSKKFGSFRLA